MGIKRCFGGTEREIIVRHDYKIAVQNQEIHKNFVIIFQ